MLISKKRLLKLSFSGETKSATLSIVESWSIEKKWSRLDPGIEKNIIEIGEGKSSQPIRNSFKSGGTKKNNTVNTQQERRYRQKNFLIQQYKTTSHVFHKSCIHQFNLLLLLVSNHFSKTLVSKIQVKVKICLSLNTKKFQSRSKQTGFLNYRKNHPVILENFPLSGLDWESCRLILE